MNKFRDALYRFMYGRNGVDALNWALVILELAVSILRGYRRHHCASVCWQYIC